ncbi:hypothetical protein NYE40_12040 [Paenibacillus sp. FSL W8-1187]|uniref:hypothetical protein n=1 Tax=Paenibacillus TaxID=44249 RepID=UPI00129A7449|nr:MULTISPECIES: hypothetical protein [Paenibacillus]QGG56317.1 hypothetical protein GE073_12495 [Paenibacillus sp. B01]
MTPIYCTGEHPSNGRVGAAADLCVSLRLGGEILLDEGDALPDIEIAALALELRRSHGGTGAVVDNRQPAVIVEFEGQIAEGAVAFDKSKVVAIHLDHAPDQGMEERLFLF